MPHCRNSNAQFHNEQSPNECPDWQAAIVNGSRSMVELFVTLTLAWQPAPRVRFLT